MTGKTQFPSGLGFLQQFWPFSLMRLMAAAAVAVGKRCVKTEAAHFLGALLMAGETKCFFVLDQQFFLRALVRIMAIKAFPLGGG